MTLGATALAEAPLAGDTDAGISATGSVSAPTAVVDGNSFVSVNILGGVTSKSVFVSSILAASVGLAGQLDSPPSLVSGNTTSEIGVSGDSVGPFSRVVSTLTVDLSLSGDVVSPSSITDGQIHTQLAQVHIFGLSDGIKQSIGGAYGSVSIDTFGDSASAYGVVDVVAFGDFVTARSGASSSLVLTAFLTSVNTSRDGSAIIGIDSVSLSDGYKDFSDVAVAGITIHVLQDSSFVVTGNAISELSIEPSASGIRWWKPSWLYRRTVRVYAMDEVPLPIGHPITIEFDSDFVSTGRVRSDMHDLWVLYGGNPIVSDAETKDGRTFVYFYAQETIPAGESRPYSVYYGNPNSADEFTSTIEIPQA